MDVYPWPGADVIVPDTAALQWESGSFDTITIIAALNHIPNRAAVLNSAGVYCDPAATSSSPC